LTAADRSRATRIDSWTRAIAEESARRAGITLGDWLNQVLIQDTAFRQPESPHLAQLAALPPLEPDESVQLAALERFAAVVEAYCAEPELTAVVEAPPPPVAPAEAVSPLEGFADDGIEPFLAGLVAQLDAVRDEMAAKIEQGAGRRLDSIERTLEQMCGYIEASDQAADVTPEPLAVTAEDTPYVAVADLDHQPVAAVKQLGLEVARAVEIVDARFARIDAEITEMIDGFAARLAAFERRDAALAAEATPPAPAEVFGPPLPPAGPADAVPFTPPAFTVAPLLSSAVAADDFDLAIPDDDWPEDLGVWPDAAGEMLAAADAPPALAPVAAAATDDDASALGKSPVLPWPGTRTERPSPRRASRLRTALMVAGGGAGLGMAVAACLLVLSGSLGAPLERQVVAANGPAAKPSHLRTREAPVELMTVTVARKPAP
jgi:hypothetical protein